MRDAVDETLPPHPLAGRAILQIVPELDTGGAERTTVDIAAALAGIGARALVATTGGRLVGELQAHGGVWLPFPAATKNPFAMALNVGKLARVIREENVALVHARSRAPAWVALGASRLTHRPFVTTYHGSYSGTSAVKVLYNSVMARGDAVIANSRYTAGLITRMHPFAAGSVEVIHRGTDLARFDPSSVAPERVTALRRAWGVTPDQRVVLLAARLTGWKGQRVLIEAAARIAREGGGADLVFVLAGDHQGRDGYVRELDDMIARHGLGERVRRVGHCDDMPAAFLTSAVVTVPSTEPEAFGRVAVEAQAMGTPVVVSDLGAVPETVAAPPDVAAGLRTGWRVPAGDVMALADAVREAAALGASARAAMAARAREHVLGQFSLRTMVDATLALYVRVLAAKAPRA